jgi:hypothetical protein
MLTYHGQGPPSPTRFFSCEILHCCQKKENGKGNFAHDSLFFEKKFIRKVPIMSQFSEISIRDY